jgi:hypothetical protein
VRARDRVSRAVWRRRLFFGASLAAPLALSCAAVPPPSEDEIDPDQVSWAGPVDFTDLRTKYGERDDFYAICEDDRPLRELYDAANREDWETVLDLSAPWLLECPVDIDAHFLRSIACGETGRAIDSTHHAIWFHGLVDSVLESGEGGPEDPYVVISIAEEYAVLRALRLEHEEQRLVAGGVDAITAREADGESVTLFFRPEAHWRRLRKVLSEED